MKNGTGGFFAAVTDPPYLAAGDGVTEDRAAIQRAIDDAYAAGGGTVTLPAGRTFRTAGLVLRSGVELHFEEGAVLQQTADPAAYVKPAGDGYVPYTPAFGHNFSPEIKWSHNWYRNYPLLFAPAGAHGFAVTGEGVIRMMDVTDPERIIKICPIGFFRCRDFVISDVRITNYHSYAMMPFTCEDGLIKNVKIDTWSHGNGDGICMMNCRRMRVTGCRMFTGDDSVYIFSSYRDPRRSEWWNSDDPCPSEDIEIDHNDLKSNHCKAFGMILWGIDCPDPEKIEVRNVYVHHNRFQTMGNWNYNPYTSKGGHPPVTGMRFEENEIEAIEINFFETWVSDLAGFPSMPQLENGHFEQGRVFWQMQAGAAVVRDPEHPWARLAGPDAAVWQGLWLPGGRPALLRAETRGRARLFVRDRISGETVALAEADSADWRETLLPFTPPRDGNYRLGLETAPGYAGEAGLRHVFLGSHPAAEGYTDVFFDSGKMLFGYGKK